MDMQLNNSTVHNVITPIQLELMGRFAPWVEGGFTEHLLPVIPPGAQISASSKTLSNKSGGKIPGKLRHDGWVGFKRFQEHRADTSACFEWAAWSASVGLQCRAFPAVDIDLEDVGYVK